MISGVHTVDAVGAALAMGASPQDLLSQTYSAARGEFAVEKCRCAAQANGIRRVRWDLPARRVGRRDVPSEGCFMVFFPDAEICLSSVVPPTIGPEMGSRT